MNNAQIAIVVAFAILTGWMYWPKAPRGRDFAEEKAVRAEMLHYLNLSPQ